jgi:hypothetical protein
VVCNGSITIAIVISNLKRRAAFGLRHSVPHSIYRSKYSTTRGEAMPSTSYPHYAWAGESPACHPLVRSPPCADCDCVQADISPSCAQPARPGRKGVPHSLLGRTRILGDRRRASAVLSSEHCPPPPLTYEPFPSPRPRACIHTGSTRAWGRRKSTAPTCSAPSSTRTSSTSSSPSTGSSRWARSSQSPMGPRS